MSKRLSPGWIVPVLVCVIGSLACRPNETLEGQAKDAKIKTQIKAKLAAEVNATTLTSVQVNVTNGVVTLAGPVHTAEEKSRVEMIAQAVPGVTKVNNDLQILGGEPFGTPLTAATPLPTP